MNADASARKPLRVGSCGESLFLAGHGAASSCHAHFRAREPTFPRHQADYRMSANVTAVGFSTSITYVPARRTVWRSPHAGHTILNEHGNSGFSLEYRSPARAKKMRSRQLRFRQSMAKKTFVVGLLAAGAFWWCNEVGPTPDESEIARGTTTTPWPALTVRTTLDAQSAQSQKYSCLPYSTSSLNNLPSLR